MSAPDPNPDAGGLTGECAIRYRELQDAIKRSLSAKVALDAANAKLLDKIQASHNGSRSRGHR